MDHQILELPAKSEYEVRLFPLPGTVFFPRNVLPLHIFESRYREMFERAIKDDQLIAMATLLPGYEDQYYSRPKISPTVCIGHVEAHERTDDGRYNFILSGLRRAQIEYEIEPVRSYRRAMVQLLDDDAHEPSSSVSMIDQLIQRLNQTVNGLEKIVEAFQDGNISLASFTDVLSFRLPLEMNVKLELLAETNPSRRTQILLASLPQPNVVDPADKEFPPRFSRN